MHRSSVPRSVTAVHNLMVPTYRLRVSNVLRATLMQLSAQSERPISWMAVQAIRQLFRSIETGAITHSEIASKASEQLLRNRKPEHKGARATLAVGNVTSALDITYSNEVSGWLRDLGRKLGVPVSGIVRCALLHWIADPSRYGLVIGTMQYTDMLMAEGPSEPPG